MPLGVQLLNENKVDEMCAILDQLQKYVPTICSSETTYLPSGESYTYQNTDMYEILFGGDQLTWAKERGAIAARSNHHTKKDQLKGLINTCSRGLAYKADITKGINYTYSVID